MTQHLQDTESLDKALEVQLRLLDLWNDSGYRVGGWKVGLTAGEKRSSFEPEYRPFGLVLAERILDSGSVVDLTVIRSCHFEPELVLILDAPLKGEVTAEEARAAVGHVAAAFEINEGRYVARATPLPIRLASGLNNWGMVVGDRIAPDDRDLRETEITLRKSGGPTETVRFESGAFDDPYVSLARLSRRLHRFGRSLNPGDCILTGAFAVRAPVPGDEWTATFEGIGDVQITFAS